MMSRTSKSVLVVVVADVGALVVVVETVAAIVVAVEVVRREARALAKKAKQVADHAACSTQPTSANE